MKTLSHKRGFSLTELLVAIGIMSLLFSVALASVAGARQVAADSKTKNDVAIVKYALQSYFEDNGGYPVCPTNAAGACCIGGPSCSAGALTATGELVALTAYADTNIRIVGSEQNSSLAAAYYSQKLNKPFLYSCGTIDTSSGVTLCPSGNAIITYVVNNTVTPEVLGDPITTPGGGSTGGGSTTTIYGCTNSTAQNFNASATQDDGSCVYVTGSGSASGSGSGSGSGSSSGSGTGSGSSVIAGCKDPSATNYNSSATVSDGSCTYAPVVIGCMDPSATNYNASATQSGTCTYPPAPVYGCTDPSASNYNPSATSNDGSCSYSTGSGSGSGSGSSSGSGS